MKTHPDNPTNIEAAAEYVAIAVQIAKDKLQFVKPVPWMEAITSEQAIRDAMGEATNCLIAELYRYHSSD